MMVVDDDPDFLGLIAAISGKLQSGKQAWTANLTRREQVRSTQTGPAVEPNPDLFRPENPLATPFPMMGTFMTQKAEPASAVPAETGKPFDRTTTTSRLLEAKRRAQKRFGVAGIAAIPIFRNR